MCHMHTNYQMNLEYLKYSAQIVQITFILLLFLELDSHGHNDFPLNLQKILHRRKEKLTT